MEKRNSVEERKVGNGNDGEVQVIELAGDEFAEYDALAMCCAGDLPPVRSVLAQADLDGVIHGTLDSQFHLSLQDQDTYHETLVHPAVAALQRKPERALILGGGDGIAARQVLRYRATSSVTLVDSNQAVTDVYKNWSFGQQLNDNALRDNRVQIVNQPAQHWLTTNQQRFDLIVVDMPALTHFQAGLAQQLVHALAEDGVISVQSTFPVGLADGERPAIVAALRAAGLQVLVGTMQLPSLSSDGVGHLLLAARALRHPKALVEWIPNLRSISSGNIDTLFTKHP